jgi:pSer/pThr/pTyr-binding forkhead associated (FHA) protein
VIKLTLRQANQPDTTVQVEGDVATIGRAQGAEVLIQQPYVSKRHVRVLRGWVVVDLGSSNGTFVAGKRITEATLLTGDEFQLGEGDVVVRVWRNEPAAAGAAGAGGEAGEVERLRAQLAEKSEELAASHAIVDRLHQKSEQLRSEVQRLRGSTPPPRDLTPAPSLAAAPPLTDETLALGVANDQITDLTGERNQLLRDMQEERAHVERLTLQVQRLETEATERRAEVARLTAALAAAASLEDLESARAEQARLLAELERTGRELDEARRKAAQAPAPALPAGPMGDLLIRLQAENSSLKRQLADASANTPTAAVSASRGADQVPPKMLAELLELRNQNQALKQQLEQRSHAVPAQMVAPARGVGALWTQLADRDIEPFAPALDGTPEEFIAIELFRVARQFERVVTRVAGAQIQLFQSNTMLPNVEGNLRGLVGTIVGDPSERDARSELVRYFDQLGKWLVAGLAANRKASKLFAEKLKHDLSEAGLTAQSPIPAFKKLSGGADGELWRRTCAYLKELSPDMLEDQLEKLSREAVREMLGTSAG